MKRQIACVALMFLPTIAYGWSSQASHTEVDIRQLALMVESYHQEVGKYPGTNEYWMELQRVELWFSPKLGPIEDRWGRPLVYRVPGKYGAFDVYSVGPDGVDDDGQRDDVSSWAGVNDGFHWKATWPAGRLTLRVGVGLALASCLLAFVYRW